MLGERVLAHMNDCERRHADWSAGAHQHWASSIAEAVGATTRSTAVALTHLCSRGLVESTLCKVGGKLYALTDKVIADSPQEASDA